MTRRDETCCGAYHSKDSDEEAACNRLPSPIQNITVRMEFVERSEGSTTILEWKLKGLKTLFDSSKGELKSEVVKSDKFGGGCAARTSL